MQLIVSYSSYAADRFFAADGTLRSQNSFRRHEISPYIEYGYSDRLTLGGKTFFMLAQQEGQPQRSNAGLGESEWFARWKTWEDAEWTLSLEPMVKLPSPGDRDDLPLLGGARPDIGFGANIGKHFYTFGLRHFVSMDTQFRHRLGPQQNQIRIQMTAGLTLNSAWQLLPQAFVTARAQSPEVASFSQSNNDDYDQTRLQCSLLYAYRDDLKFQIGTYADVAGRNTGAGRGVILSLWKSY